MSTHNISIYKEVDKTYTGYNLKTTELFECALIGVCVVIRSNTVGFIELPVINANSVDPDQMLHCEASDLGLLHLPIIQLGVSHLK